MKNHTTDRQRAEGKPKYKVGDKVIVVIAEGKVINQPGEVTRFSAGCYEILGYNGQQYVCEPKPEEMVKNNWQCGKCQGMKLPEHHRMCKLRYQLQPLAEEPSKNEEKIDSTQGQPYSDYKDTAPEEWKKKIKDLFRLLHAVGSFTNSGDEGEQPYREELFAAYDAICQWRHDKPYLDDEIDSLLQARDERAVEIVNSMSLDTDEWIDSRVSDAFAKTKKEAMTAIRANRSERREE